jgi:hypothetical protein
MGVTLGSLMLREEHKLRVLRRIFEQQRDKVTGDWRKLHIEELITCTFCQVKEDGWVGHVGQMSGGGGGGGEDDDDDDEHISSW